MRTLTRYILFQLLSIFLLALTVLTGVIIIGGVVREAWSQGLGMVHIVRLVPYILPDAMRFAVPATILFATCMVFGRLASSNEIVAIKSMGISPWKVLWPAFAAVTLLSFAAVWLNDLAVSWGRKGVRRVVIESVEEVAYGMLQSQRRYSTSKFSINVQRIEGRRLIRPTVTFKLDKKSSIVARAKWAELHADTAADTLTIKLHDGSIIGEGLKSRFPGTIEHVLPLSHASRKNVQTAGPSQMSLREIPDAIAQQVLAIEGYEQQLAAQAAFEMFSGDFVALSGSSWDEPQLKLVRMRQFLFRLKTEPHRRWAAGFSCLCFVAVGAPLAVRRRHGEFWTTFFMCFMPILIAYYPLLMFSLDRAKLGALPPYSVWLGNVVLLVWGAWLLRRVLRY